MQITSLASNLTPQLSTTSQIDTKGLTLGRSSQRGQATTGTLTAKAPTTTSETFAAEILRRLQAARTASNAGALVDSGAAGDLQKSLSDAIDSVRQAHGDAAATAVMGIVLKGVGDGKGGEDSLGNALVSSLSFIDRNFGIASGDAAMAKFNGKLNDSINNYFQNGQNEVFHAVETTGSAADQIQSVLSTTLSNVSQRFGDATAKAVSNLLTESLKKTGYTREGLGTALSAADASLTDQYGASATDATGALADQPGAPTDLAKGTVLDLAV